MRVQRSITKPIRAHMRWEDLWEGADDGLIACWERGREMRIEAPELAAKALAGQLVVLPWSGGYEQGLDEEVPKAKQGSMFYLAMRQGLRGEDLDVDTSVKVRLTCSLSGVIVAFKPRSVAPGENHEFLCAPGSGLSQ